MSSSKQPPPARPTLHPRNRYQGHYDFARLVAAHPPLAAHVTANPAGEPSIVFSDARAVRALNRALLAEQYGIVGWDIPDGFLCPPIPGRADYIHHVADLLAGDADGDIPCNTSVRVLDVGVGANCIYPLLGHRSYGWHFVGSDINERALRAAADILAANPSLQAAIVLRRQPDAAQVLRGVIDENERFDLTICNPPFHDSPASAQAGTVRKWRNLGQPGGRPVKAGRTPALNFGGQADELWCPGGETAFIHRMIADSRHVSDRCLWFTTLVSKADNLPAIRHALARAGVVERRVLTMGQGQKQSRIVAWTFLTADARRTWARTHWPDRRAAVASSGAFGVAD